MTGQSGITRINRILALTAAVLVSLCLLVPAAARADAPVDVRIPVVMEEKGGTAVLVDGDGVTVQTLELGDGASGMFSLSLPYADTTYTVKQEKTDAAHMDSSVYTAHIVTYISDSGEDTYALILTRDDGVEKCDSCSFSNRNDPENNDKKKDNQSGSRKGKDHGGQGDGDSRPGGSRTADAVKTGDSREPLLYLAAMCAAAAALLLTGIGAKRRRE